MPKTPKTVDVVVGQNIHLIRKSKGISQQKLGESLDLTFQQIQKYEKGTNRVSASALVSIAKALGCRLEDLFAGIDINGEVITTSIPTYSAKAQRGAGLIDRLPDTLATAAIALLREMVLATSDKEA